MLSKPISCEKHTIYTSLSQRLGQYIVKKYTPHKITPRLRALSRETERHGIRFASIQEILGYLNS